MMDTSSRNWATDFDHLDPAWTEDPFPIWKSLRECCPMAHSDRYGGVYLPTRYEDIVKAAYDHDVFSSRTIIVRNVPLVSPFFAPPMNAVGERHRLSRKRLLPAFTRQKVETYRGFAAADARKLAASATSKNYDIASDFAYQLSVRTVMRIVGAPQYDCHLLTGWTRNVLLFGVGDAAVVDRTASEMANYCTNIVLKRYREPMDDVASLLIEGWDGADSVFVAEAAVTLRLILLAGIDTTASVLTGALRHLAESPITREKIATKPDLIPSAIEEFLRVYAPTTMARLIEQDTVLAGMSLKAGQLLLLPFPAANRDPAVFPDPDHIDLNRHPNKHLAFGAGVHRCIGDHLAKMIISVGLQEWLACNPNYSVDEDRTIEWSPGTVRGMSRLFIRLETTDPTTSTITADTVRNSDPRKSTADAKLTAHAAQLFDKAKKLQTANKPHDALKAYRSILQKHPYHIDSLLGIGAVALTLGKEAAARSYFQRAVALAPQDFRPLHNLAMLAVRKSRLNEALAYAEAAMRAAPDFADAHRSIADVLNALGRSAEGLRHATRASDLKPDDVGLMLQKVFLKRQVCDWHEFEEDNHRVRSFVACGRLVPPFAFLSADASNAEQHVCAKRWAQTITKPIGQQLLARKPESGRPLRVGYLSGDFHDHATSTLVVQLFESHDRTRVKVYGYSYGPDEKSSLRERMVRSFDVFRDVKDISSETIARRIHQDEIDILVDMKGYTNRARTEILTWRPAPIQVNYLGFPGTMGANFIDYVITDRNVSPPIYQSHSTERFAYLPHCFQPNDTLRSQPDGSITRAHFGIPENAFVYTCFNAAYKFTPKVFSTWMRILKAVPGSLLLLLSRSHEQNEHLRREARVRGVTPHRLLFAPSLERSQHLARCALADLFLDTVPVSAFTTASDALWAGLPTLTVAGSTPAGRGSMSLLYAMGLPELVAADLDSYEEIAIQLARMPDRLWTLRRRVEDGRYGRPPFDTCGLARDLETLYEGMILKTI